MDTNLQKMKHEINDTKKQEKTYNVLDTRKYSNSYQFRYVHLVGCFQGDEMRNLLKNDVLPLFS